MNRPDRYGNVKRGHAAHAGRGHGCECGRTIYSNAAIQHFRTCRAYLEVNGWPFTVRQTADLIADLHTYLDPADIIDALHQVRMTEARVRGLIRDTGATT